MTRCKGTVVAMRQCSGCVEVTVEGEAPGSFIIDNGCFWIMAANIGPDWIGLAVEYQDAHMRFLDSPEARHEAESEDHASLPALP